MTGNLKMQFLKKKRKHTKYYSILEGIIWCAKQVVNLIIF